MTTVRRTTMKARRIATILCVLVCSCSRAEIRSSAFDVHYYASIVFRETPYAKMEGLIRLVPQQVKRRAHYRFVYDKEERIVEVSFMQGDSYKSPNHTVDEYQFPSPIIRTAYETGKEIKTFYNRFGKQISVRGGVYREVFEYDERGNRQTMLFENERGDPVENDWGVARYAWTLQDDGPVIERRFNLAGEPQPLRPWFPFHTVRLLYDPNGYISLMQNIDDDGNLVENDTGVAQDKIEFDSKGRWLGWRVLDKQGNLVEGNGPNVARGINTPNEFGYEAAIRFEDRYGNPLRNAHGFWGSKRFYDGFGNLTQTVFVDSLGDPGPNEITGYTYAVFEYDDVGMNRIATRLLDVNKRPIAHASRGYSIVKYEYDDAGDLTRISFYDKGETLSNRLDSGVAYIKRKYDPVNGHVEATSFD